MLNKESNDLSKQVAAEKDAIAKQALIAKGKEIKERLPEMREKEARALDARDEKLYSIGNLVHDSVPVSMDEKDNGVRTLA